MTKEDIMHTLAELQKIENSGTGSLADKISCMVKIHNYMDEHKIKDFHELAVHLS